MAGSKGKVYSILFAIGAKTNSVFGKTFKGADAAVGKLNKTVGKTPGAAKKANAAMNALGEGAKNLAHNVGGAILKFAAAYLSINALKSAYDSLKSVWSEHIRSITLLNSAMMKKEGATRKDIETIQKYASTLQGLTVIGNDVSVAGAAQIATYTKEKDSVLKMMPAMADLAAHQYGAAVSAEQMEGTAKSLGEALAGDAGSLKSLGLMLSETQQKTWATMTEQQRLAVIVGETQKQFGGLAAELRNTPDGRAAVLSNEWSDVKKTLAEKVMPIQERFVTFMIEKMPWVHKQIERFCGFLDGLSRPFAWLLNTGKEVFGAIQKAIMDNFSPADTLGGKAQSFGEMLMGAFQKAQPAIDWLKNEGIPKLIGLIAAILGKAKEFGGWVVVNWSKIKPIVMGIVGAFIAFKAVMLVSKGILIAYNAIQAVLGAKKMLSSTATFAETAAQWGLNAAFLACPITWIIAGIILLIGILWLIVANWEKISAWLHAAWQALYERFGGTIDAIKETFTNCFNSIKQIWDGIKQFFSNLFKGVVLIFQGKWAEAGQCFGKAFDGLKKIWNGITGFFKGLWDGVVKIISNFVVEFKKFFEPLVKWFTDVFGKIGDFFSNLFGGAKKAQDEVAKVPTSAAGGEVPAYASGGWVKRPTLALVGEGRAQEAIIPMDGSRRAQTLWREAGEGLGLLDTATTSAASAVSAETHFQIQFAPQINLNSGDESVREEVKRAVALSFDDFKRMLEQLLQEQGRLRNA